MKKKEIYLELVHDIPSLIKLQKYSLAELKKTVKDQGVIDFQEDVLKCLEALNKIEIVNLDNN